MSLVLQPQAWVRVDLTPITGSPGDPISWQASVLPMADASDYYDGFKQPLIERFEDAERALSEPRSGGFEVSTFSFVTNDKSGFWRGLLLDPDTQYLTGSDVTFRLISESGRAAEVEPRTAFRGQLERPAPLPGKKFRIAAQSRVGSRYGPVDLQGPILKRTYSNIDWPQIPRDFEGTAVPFLWGEISDKGTVNANGEDIATGMVFAKYLGPVFVGMTSGTPPTEPTFLPDPPAPTFLRVGSGGSSTWDLAVSVRTANGHTRLSPATRITNVPSNGHWTGGESDPDDYPDNGGVVSLEPYSAELMEEVTGADLWARQIISGIPGSWHKVDAAGQMFNSTANEYFAGPAGYMANGDDSFLKSSPAPPNTNTAQITPGSPGVEPGSIFYDFFGLLGHQGKLTTLYATNLAEEPEYEAVGDGDGNFVLNDGEGVLQEINGHAYWGFYAKGPKAEAAKAGTFPFRANICGWHEDNDTANPIIDQAFYVYQDVFTQLAGGDNWEGYQSGDRLTVPSFKSSPAIPILQTSTFEHCQYISARYLGDVGGSPGGAVDVTGGYKATVYLDSLDTTWGQFIEGMNRTFQCDLGENHHGQIIAAMMDDMADPDEGLLLREKIEIVRVQNAGEVVDDEIENVVNYQFDWHPIDSKYRSGTITILNQDSIDGYGRRVGPSLDMPYTRDPVTAADTASRRLLHYMIAPQYPSIVCRFRRAMEAEIGQQVRFQHSDFVTDQAIPIYLRRHRMSYSAGEVTLTGRDRRGTLAVTWAPEDTVGTDYSDATAEERSTYFFWGNDDGTLPDGTLGSRWR